MQEQPKLKKANFNITEEQHEWLRELAHERHSTQSAVVREALDVYRKTLPQNQGF